MRSFINRNINTMFPRVMDDLLANGEREESRNGPVIVYAEPVCMTYELPWERVLFSTKRRANPFFHLFESMWMLAGREDAAFLDRYIHDFGARYAEADGRLHGAYGRRWRFHFDKDQLDWAVQSLQKDPASRRTVITMYDPDIDSIPHNENFTSPKDIPCLAGDTIVWSPEGDLPISSLAEMFQNKEISRWPVYGVDETTKEVKLTWCSNAWCSGVRKTVKVNFDDGSHIIATPDHVLYKRKRRAVDAWPILAGELRPGDRVLATKLFVDTKGYLKHKKLLGINTKHGNMVKVHQEYSSLLEGEIPSGIDVHHKDENKSRNTSSNLLRMPHGEHSALKMMGDKNPSNRANAAQREVRAKKQSDSIRKTWASLTPNDRKRRARGLPLVDNHRVISVEPYAEIPVYDFTVPETHTAIVGTGVVAHNCNTHMYLRLRKGALELTVCCRSNDAIWGAFGANVVHFSVLQEYLAHRLGCGIGPMHVMSNNFHVYESTLHLFDPDEAVYDPYSLDHTAPHPLFTFATDGPFIEILNIWMTDPSNTIESHTYPAWPFTNLLIPMSRVHDAIRVKQWDDALRECDYIIPEDWRATAKRWIITRPGTRQ